MKLDDVKKLHQKKYRTQYAYYLVEGEHLILELNKALGKSAQASMITVYVSTRFEGWVAQHCPTFKAQVLSDKQMAQISDTKTPQGIIARVPLPKSDGTSAHIEHAPLRSIYLHEVQDPGNLGTILRSLAWFGQFRLLLSPNSVDPYNAKVVRASMGAIFHVPMELDVPLDDLAARFTRFAYLDMQGKPVNSAEFSNYDCYLFGNEARGVPRDALAQFNAQAFTIAGCGLIDSLNLASALNICVYELSK